MNINVPKSITRPKPFLLTVEFSDGYRATVKLEKFRKECPCAACKGEEIMGQVVAPPMMQMFSPGQNELKSLTPVGNYAVTAVWGDGHDTGIYSWDYMREIFEKYALSEEELAKLEQKSNNK